MVIVVLSGLALVIAAGVISGARYARRQDRHRRALLESLVGQRVTLGLSGGGEGSVAQIEATIASVSAERLIVTNPRPRVDPSPGTFAPIYLDAPPAFLTWYHPNEGIPLDRIRFVTGIGGNSTHF